MVREGFDVSQLYDHGSSDPGTVFQREDLSSPGSAPDVEDISGYPLPPISDEGDRYFAQTNGTFSPTSQREGLASDQGPADSTITSDTPSDGRRRRTARERIAQLTQQRRDAERENHALQERFAEVQDRLERQQRELEALRRQPREGPSTQASHPGGQGVYDYAYSQQTAPQTLDGGQAAMSFQSESLRDDIRRAVSETMAPILAREEERTRREALNRDQNFAWQRVVEEFPEFANPQSREAQTFAEVWDKHPLREHGDGPLHVAYMVRGIVADEAAEERGRTQRKIGAQIVPTAPTVGPAHASHATDQEKFRKIFEERARRLRAGSGDDADYIEMRKAQRRAMPRAGRISSHF